MSREAPNNAGLIVPLLPIVPVKSPGTCATLLASSNPVSISVGALNSAGVLGWHIVTVFRIVPMP